jgi:hypothetical protein
MSNVEESMEKNNEEQDDDIYDEEDPKNTMTSQETPTKSDIHAWRKRNSYAFQRNPLLVRRMSRGEQYKQKEKIVIPYRGLNRSIQGVVYCLYSNLILFLFYFVRGN